MRGGTKPGRERFARRRLHEAGHKRVEAAVGFFEARGGNLAALDAAKQRVDSTALQLGAVADPEKINPGRGAADNGVLEALMIGNGLHLHVIGHHDAFEVELRA